MKTEMNITPAKVYYTCGAVKSPESMYLSTADLMVKPLSRNDTTTFLRLVMNSSKINKFTTP